MKTITKIAITILALLTLGLVAGCSEENSSTSYGSDPESTSSEPTLSVEQVEGYFAAERSKRAARVESNGSGLVSVEDESCTIDSPGKATCIELIHYQVGTLEKDDTTVWHVTYTQDGEITSYTK